MSELMDFEFPHLMEVLNDYADAFQELFKRKIKDGDSFATGDLYNSIKTFMRVNGETYSVEMSLLDYWIWIDRGRSKGAKYPPINKLEDWIKVKGIVPRQDIKPVPTTKQLAFLIARKIHEEGIEPKPYYKETFEELWLDFEERIKEAIDLDSEEIALVIMKEYVESTLQDLPIKYQKLF